MSVVVRSERVEMLQLAFALEEMVLDVEEVDCRTWVSQMAV